MRKFLLLALLLSASTFAYGIGTDSVQLQVTMVRGESSRDSHSVRATIAISGQKLTYTKSYTGRLSGRAPERKEFDLTVDDLKTIGELIKTRNLLVKETIERQGAPKGTYMWFDLIVQAEMNGTAGLIRIKGPRNAIDIKDERLYKDSLALIDALFGMIHRSNPDIDYEPLIN